MTAQLAAQEDGERTILINMVVHVSNQAAHALSERRTKSKHSKLTASAINGFYLDWAENRPVLHMEKWFPAIESSYVL